MHATSALRLDSNPFRWTLVAHGLFAAGGVFAAYSIGLFLGMCATALLPSFEIDDVESSFLAAHLLAPWLGQLENAILFAAFAAAAVLVGFRSSHRRALHAVLILAAVVGVELVASGAESMLALLMPGSGIVALACQIAALAAIALLFCGLDRRRRVRDGDAAPGSTDDHPGGQPQLLAFGCHEFVVVEPHRPLRDLFENVRAGLPIALFARAQPGRFRISGDQVLLLVVLGFASQLGWEWLLVDSPARFELEGLAVHASGLLLTIGFAALVGREEDAPDTTLRLLVMLLSTIPVAWLGFAVLDRSVVHLDWLSRLVDDMYWGTLFAVWLAPVSIRVLRAATHHGRSQCIALGLLHASAIHVALDQLPSGFVVFSEAPTAPAKPQAPPLDAEAILHEQRDRLAEAIAHLAPERPGRTDLYVIAFGADASEGVSRNESTFVRELFDDRYGTKGRSLLLVNHREALTTHPLASRTNLGEALLALGGIIDREQDIVVVFMTGHGGRDHDIYVRFRGLPLNSFGPAELDGMFEKAGIRSRIVIVSACYSGGYVDRLADSDTLVLSAAARDRSSFGCSDEARLTDFGKAYFDEALDEEPDLVRAFELAKVRIEAREIKRELTPSRPQIAVGRRIARKLDTWMQQEGVVARPIPKPGEKPKKKPHHVIERPGTTRPENAGLAPTSPAL